MDFYAEWLMLIAVSGIAMVSPGPDFVMAVRNSIVYSRKIGIFTAIGFGLGVCVHVFYSLAGIAAIIAQSVLLFTVIKFIGAAYLIYIGFKALRSPGYQASPEMSENINGKKISTIGAVRSGFITNLFNPKATLFFLALFTQIINPHTPLAVLMLYGATCVFLCIGWFSIVALVLTNVRIKKIFLSFSRWIDRVCGGLLIALGVKLVMNKG